MLIICSFYVNHLLGDFTPQISDNNSLLNITDSPFLNDSVVENVKRKVFSPTN